ncbi:hypothetical protein CVT26_012949 [Gymnopilus dilepis]|uniref:Uncharacterized protein n=1 Tax=Gymnopilus dilepis TaxID=231916 RepID=A0A409X5E3_9AGAR|nr:hypothetical protein CVT26_012949 [Gymnopilus dilepis]
MQDATKSSEPAVNYYYNTPYPSFPRVSNIPDDKAVSETHVVVNGTVPSNTVNSPTTERTSASSADRDENKFKGPKTSKKNTPYPSVKVSGDYIRRRKRDHALEGEVFTLLEM